ncbi:glycosyltransferase family 2 protein [Candidatus Oleimmundimicrobium sp.]|uniref:glycosyltransferase family 2 protein n=1 Tax=Candidatus Oleimmundimicrobium sp. TaxID=3060597 RepID=UPI002718B4BC|nr:glycosyltransferase family 2 protein [Candidatus Oleimmundimicrobium sp.]MDO8885453.1 glycosyltransferase family 2 protein [Candidatus Oleimmundimicrobium sp.]
MEEAKTKIALIIPAYNEAKRIGLVLDEAIKVQLIDEIIVVDDGSTDDTAEVAKKYKRVKVINREENGGKGAALSTGIDSTDAAILVLIDADLIGLKTVHIESLIKPLLEEDLDMTLGKFTGGRMATDISQALVPRISGQRAFKREILERMPDFTNCGYGVEIAFAKQAKRKHARVKEVVLPNVTHVMKEEKMGLRKGILSRLGMYRDILFHLIFKHKD